LALKPYDIVEVEQVLEDSTTTTTMVPGGSLAKLRPHSREFAQDITNPQSVLETELRHYSSLTQGSTISMKYNHKIYWFDVEELRSAPRGEKAPMVKVQDSNVATEFLLSKDQVLERKRRKQGSTKE
jgi:Ubiquitin fusion degradation protein UFD1